MYLMQLFAESEIKIDFNEEIVYDTEDVWDDGTDLVAVVEMELAATDGLVRLARFYRERTGKTIDPESHFNFYIRLSDWGTCLTDHDIIAVYNSDDICETYEIEMTPDDRWRVLRVLNKQCTEHLGKSVSTLMAESRKTLEAEQKKGE